MFMILDLSNEKVYEGKHHSHFNTFSQEIEISKISKYSKFLKPLDYLFSVKSSILISLWSDLVTKQYITLIVPMNYSRYPEEYSSWLKEFLYPQPSVFIETCKKSFYVSLNGEAITVLILLGIHLEGNIIVLFGYYLVAFESFVDENGNILNETLIQVPSENTNLFYSYSTSLLATYLFLTGNQNSLSPWAPKPTAENIIFILNRY
ncbi:hypothetical protein GLOIN_2v1781806 [Rhizophagus clarus]|uniref:Uncharacterized protein n=1 Tax=Rhizophagus clarus TaxID=94130 RepID=A0A8H3LAI8_9GLOM|nr:hypothetical protein GLOIN_2v1781806 [Rhizophagus clarus]